VTVDPVCDPLRGEMIDTCAGGAIDTGLGALAWVAAGA
jgi:hypothetical protein